MFLYVKGILSLCQAKVEMSYLVNSQETSIVDQRL